MSEPNPTPVATADAAGHVPAPPSDAAAPAEAGTGTTESPEARIATLEEKLAAAEAALAEERDRFLRKAAEFDNIRRRLASEAQRQSEAGKLDFIRSILAVADTLELALQTPADADSVEHLRQGVQFTLEKFAAVLREHGVEPIAALDAPFDPTRHEAVAMQRHEDKADHSVVQVYRAGYVRGDQVLRPAQVVVNQLS
jgi:molecular chaperone GrpE